MATVCITVNKVSTSETLVFVVNDDSELVKRLANKASILFLDLSATTKEKEATERQHASIVEPATEEEGGASLGKRRKLSPPELDSDADVQAFTDLLAAWLESEGLPAVEGDVGTFADEPKNLVAGDKAKRGQIKPDIFVPDLGPETGEFPNRVLLCVVGTIVN